MKKKLNVGIVGFGYMGKMHAMCYEAVKFYYSTDVEVHLYAVATTKKPEELPVRFDRYYSEAEDLIRDPAVDIVDICGPNFRHKDLLIQAMKEKKYIYCEKPLTTDLFSAREVIRFKESSGYNRTNRVAFEYRFVPAVMRAKQLISEGVLGKLIHFTFKYYGCEFLDPNRCISWQSKKELAGGGVLYAMGTHSIDLIRYLIGDVTEVFAQTRTHFKERPLKENPEKKVPVEIEDVVNAQLTCGQDVVGNLLLSQVAAGSGIDFSFEIYGEKGALKFNHENANVLYYFNNEDTREPIGGYGGFKAIETTQKYGGEAVFPPPRVTISWSRYHIASLYEFIWAAANNQPAFPDLEDACQVQKITDAIYRSAAERKIESVMD